MAKEGKSAFKRSGDTQVIGKDGMPENIDAKARDDAASKAGRANKPDAKKTATKS